MNEILNLVIALFVIIDPLTNGPIFHSMTSHLPGNVRRRIITKSVAVATAVLLTFAVLGDYIVKPFGMNLTDVRMATGLILLVYSIQALLGQTEAQMIDPESIAIVPMAIPMLAGPGAISLVLYYRSVCGAVCTSLAVVIVMLISLPLLRYGEVIYRILGKNGITALSRIIAILLAGLGVAMIRESAIEILSQLVK